MALCQAPKEGNRRQARGVHSNAMGGVRLLPQRAHEVVAQPVRRDDEEYLIFLTISFIHAPVSDFDSLHLELILDALNV